MCAVIEPSVGAGTLVGFTPHPRDIGGFRYVNHHSSATPGDFGAAVAAVARQLGIEAVEV